MKVTPLNQFRELQILWLFPARSSDTGTAGTGIEILGSCSAHPLGLQDMSHALPGGGEGLNQDERLGKKLLLKRHLAGQPVNQNSQ